MNLLKALATVSSMTLVSRVLGFVRDAVIARTFGAGLATDAFFVAFKLPNLLRRIFAEGAFSQAFVPILAEYRRQRGEQGARVLVDHVATALALVLLGVTILGIVAAPLIVLFSAPGFAASPDKFHTTVELLRITFPYVFFISLTSLCGAVLNSWSRFSVPALAPALLNVSFIVFALFLAPHFNPPVMALAWAVFAGGVLQLGFQLPFLKRIGMLPRLNLDLRDEGVWRILRLMGPAVFGVSVGQVSLLINGVFASFLQTGSVSWLYYADRLMEFPTGVLGVALGTILLPSLSRAHAAGGAEEFSRLLDWGLRLTLLLAAPAALALALLATPLVATLFLHGAFSAHDVAMTRNALMAYSLGLVGLIVVKVLAPGFFSRQDIRTPVKIALVTLAATQVMNLAFIYPLRHAGLALAIGLGACLNATLLYRALRRSAAYQPAPGWGRFLARLALALGVMGTVLWFAAGAEAGWLTGSLLARAGRLTALVVMGAASYFAALWALGFRLRDFHLRAS
ncbi:MAG: murein biosynthesis integral membrane protein MurJ [Betaproteobacteria bacterium]|nr:murein biosynthesis integral membrane protein MurJ [Rhodocyclaceae bacterium]MCA3132978.1 murein biosynthesis integral membrane protein MurJ [Rhodocyclaceae bacterium]MCA3141943.1 murein biosynthesis integral membrane protein MurJ [Rhodocyclaceae bacterium]MCA3144851.1 murein biosynthesis integral membrane protein MurJ [Rhodocyclaceae bacterium]MCE2898747.1 murein biosynthesis integral membrane protein MurJ [Betaproteobacteria bacterium]